MAPAIRISDLTMQRLKKWAEPLEDTADDAVSKALLVAEACSLNHGGIKKPVINGRTSVDEEPEESIEGSTVGHELDKAVAQSLPLGKRLRKGLKTNQRQFRESILLSALSLDGKGDKNTVLDRVGELMKSRLNSYDLEPLSTGETRWRNSAAWERKRMIGDGLMKADSPIGVWELADAGIEAAKHLFRQGLGLEPTSN